MKTNIACQRVHAIDCGFHIDDNCDPACPGFIWDGIHEYELVEKVIIDEPLERLGKRKI